MKNSRGSYQSGIARTGEKRVRRNPGIPACLAVVWFQLRSSKEDEARDSTSLENVAF